MHPGRDPGNWIARRGLPHRAAPRCVTPDLRTEMRCARIRRRRGTTDRKSTRLNSSHGYISYAVFCLQKKILDLVFSIDSVVTALGISEHLAVIVSAVVLAMIVMLAASGAVAEFVYRHPTVRMLAISL